MDFFIQDLKTVLKADFVCDEILEVVDIADVSIDSRSLRNNNNTLFFAIQGQNFDAHLFIEDLISKGIRYFVVQKIPQNLETKAVFFVVDDSLKAFQDFVAFYRSKFDFPVIGITGSNGKTIVKEWLNFLLSSDFTIIKSPKSYNSQVGVPLSVIAINENHNLGIFEAGISLPNEMDALERIIQPNIGILTSIGSAHDEGFQNREQKILEKLKLFKNVDVLICESNQEVLKLISSKAKLLTWSFKNEGNINFNLIKVDVLEVSSDFGNFEIKIPFVDKSSLQNIATCVSILLYLNIPITDIQKRIANLYRVEMRLQIKNGIQNCTIIDDSYSSDYQSLKIALDVLENHKTHENKTVILSDIFQSGFDENVLYAKVEKLLLGNKIHRVFAIGNKIKNHLSQLENVIRFDSTQDFLFHFKDEDFANETILLKGARSFEFEKIVALLEEKKHETVLEINLDAVTHNLNFYKSKLKPETKIMVMVKAFGYGNGSFEIAKLLQHHKVDYLGVAFADEGVELRNAGITMPIIVMNPENSAFSTMIAYHLEPEIYGISELNAFIKVAQSHNLYKYPIHLKLNTGMNRLGFVQQNFDELIPILKASNLLEVKSIFSHLATSDMPEEIDFTHEQLKKFKLWSNELIHKLDINPIRHILNTSGIYNFSGHQYEMVRVGIGLYGVGNDVFEDEQLQNVATLKTLILQINEVQIGESVGYGRRFVANRKSKIATIPIGYADGIRRAWGNEVGYVIINNKKAAIVGAICMDMMMIDVTEIDCEIGTEVLIFGEQLRVTEIAKFWNTIPYEVMTGISQRVKRIFYKE
ncbi:bifunctional UDP-N-acetylmuramoyl-tripeptide:D-alanyl-D-alanine ligase/alanine racemase [Paenimyroides tangerinum]|uniref:Alanine racemase n=1 Tax=Paenimyroides tangerinum TaxID=2488728 RepID=A0A3P3WHC6_9FLAO|nr:bifunctional UDP-N-acetylmuramoyl-tripeptide:D-alanyl-D-alanine ligase/alanine racemase [Paenimyroides tangerinum]RRJ93149.1 bifunctional UDP-N-acetylmuramoyl-tripeptide:D-alanyl-D-alanine ligase/alanine racemase [Paenimyroides tangerinum]